MCCRLQLDLRELVKRGNGLFGSAEQTGSIGVVTINLARLGFLFRDEVGIGGCGESGGSQGKAGVGGCGEDGGSQGEFGMCGCGERCGSLG